MLQSAFTVASREEDARCSGLLVTGTERNEVLIHIGESSFQLASRDLALSPNENWLRGEALLEHSPNSLLFPHDNVTKVVHAQEYNAALKAQKAVMHKRRSQRCLRIRTRLRWRHVAAATTAPAHQSVCASRMALLKVSVLLASVTCSSHVT